MGNKKVIPFGDRILVKRRKVGEKIGSFYLPDQTKDRDTDLAVVMYVPEHTFADKELINNAEKIVSGLVSLAVSGDVEALKALLEYNHFLKIKSIKVGDEVMVNKYVGTTFHDNQGENELTMCHGEDVIGLVVSDG